MERIARSDDSHRRHHDGTCEEGDCKLDTAFCAFYARLSPLDSLDATDASTPNSVPSSKSIMRSHKERRWHLLPVAGDGKDGNIKDGDDHDNNGGGGGRVL